MLNFVVSTNLQSSCRPYRMLLDVCSGAEVLPGITGGSVTGEIVGGGSVAISLETDGDDDGS